MFRTPRDASPVGSVRASSQDAARATQCRLNRRRLQFSLRFLLLLTFGLSVLCALLSWLWRARAQQAVADAIVARGGRVQFTYQPDGNGYILPDPEPPGSALAAANHGELLLRHDRLRPGHDGPRD